MRVYVIVQDGMVCGVFADEESVEVSVIDLDLDETPEEISDLIYREYDQIMADKKDGKLYSVW